MPSTRFVMGIDRDLGSSPPTMTFMRRKQGVQTAMMEYHWKESEHCRKRYLRWYVLYCYLDCLCSHT
jgi:hypothetical protein